MFGRCLEGIRKLYEGIKQLHLSDWVKSTVSEIRWIFRFFTNQLKLLIIINKSIIFSIIDVTSMKLHDCEAIEIERVEEV